MTTCPGKRPVSSGQNATVYCGNSMWKCKKCGAVGCRGDKCSNQIISGNKCLKCGAYDTAQSF